MLNTDSKPTFECYVCYLNNFCMVCNKNVWESDKPWHDRVARFLDLAQKVGVIHYACESF